MISDDILDFQFEDIDFDMLEAFCQETDPWTCPNLVEQMNESRTTASPSSEPSLPPSSALVPMKHKPFKSRQRTSIQREERKLRVYSINEFRGRKSIEKFPGLMSMHMGSTNWEGLAALMRTFARGDCVITRDGGESTTISGFLYGTKIAHEMHPDTIGFVQSIRSSHNSVYSKSIWKTTDCPTLSRACVQRHPKIFNKDGGAYKNRLQVLKETANHSLEHSALEELSPMLESDAQITVNGTSEMIAEFDEITKMISKITIKSTVTSITKYDPPKLTELFSLSIQ